MEYDNLGYGSIMLLDELAFNGCSDLNRVACYGSIMLLDEIAFNGCSSWWQFTQDIGSICEIMSLCNGL